MDVGVLDGLRVVEASAFVAAPLGGMTLAQMGADVIRIDPLGGGLDYRRWPVTDDDTSLFWCGLNQCKRSVALDLSCAEGREIAMALVTAPGDDAGIFVTNFPPRGWLDHEALRARRADLIQLTLQGDRHGGSAVDYTVNPRLGLPAITGPSDSDEPVNHVLPAWDLITGQMVAVGLLAAERHRRRTGQGRHVKLALQDVGLAVMALVAAGSTGCSIMDRLFLLNTDGPYAHHARQLEGGVEGACPPGGPCEAGPCPPGGRSGASSASCRCCRSASAGASRPPTGTS